jgi:CMP-N,N'-diacetyllegionaminic acid synthase
MSVLAIIPARAGSKGIRNKNLVEVGGKPLVDWTLDAVEESQAIEKAILTSDGPPILDRARGKTLAFQRAPYHSTDDSQIEGAMGEVLDAISLEQPPYDIIVLLQPTSPLRRGRHIDEAVQMLRDSDADCVISVVPSHVLLWRSGIAPLYPIQMRPRRQDLQQFEENGAIYAFTRKHWERTRNRIGGKTLLYEMSEEHGYQVDTELDLWLMEHLLNRSRPELRGHPAPEALVAASGATGV